LSKWFLKGLIRADERFPLGIDHEENLSIAFPLAKKPLRTGQKRSV
jgi:hypothetical protein